MTAIAIPVELLPIDLTAMVPAMAQFRQEYESKTCAVCGSHKWANYPFCRLCSIKLQRKHMMWFFDNQIRIIRAEVNCAASEECLLDKWPAQVLQDYWKHYEVCRDYLIVSRRDGERTFHGSTDDSEI